jgi:two-component SAPR family response regulator
VVVERERLHVLRLEALNAAAESCLNSNDPVRALEFALTAVRAEPLRESSWRLVVTAHREQGNVADVRRAFTDYRDLIDRELGVVPSPLMLRLVDDIGSAVPAHSHTPE